MYFFDRDCRRSPLLVGDPPLKELPPPLLAVAFPFSLSPFGRWIFPFRCYDETSGSSPSLPKRVSRSPLISGTRVVFFPLRPSMENQSVFSTLSGCPFCFSSSERFPCNLSRRNLQRMRLPPSSSSFKKIFLASPSLVPPSSVVNNPPPSGNRQRTNPDNEAVPFLSSSAKVPFYRLSPSAAMKILKRPRGAASPLLFRLLNYSNVAP